AGSAIASRPIPAARRTGTREVGQRGHAKGIKDLLEGNRWPASSPAPRSIVRPRAAHRIAAGARGILVEGGRPPPAGPGGGARSRRSWFANCQEGRAPRPAVARSPGVARIAVFAYSRALP